jgi:hypothetical protein
MSRKEGDTRIFVYGWVDHNEFKIKAVEEHSRYLRVIGNVVNYKEEIIEQLYFDIPRNRKGKRFYFKYHKDYGWLLQEGDKTGFAWIANKDYPENRLSSTIKV